MATESDFALAQKLRVQFIHPKAGEIISNTHQGVRMRSI